MKSILALLTMMTSFAFANDNLSTIKLLDGRVATCKSDVDVRRGQAGVFGAEAVDLDVDLDQLYVDVVLRFYTCQKIGDKYEFVTRSPYGLIEFSRRGFTNIVNEIVMTPLDLELRAYVDGQYEIVSQVKIPNVDSFELTVTPVIPLKLLFSQEQLEKAKRGDSFSGEFDLYLFQKVHTQVTNNPEIDFVRSGGSGLFRVYFKIDKTLSGFKARFY